MDAIFSEYDREGSPGMAVGVYQDGKEVFAKGYGYAHLEHNIPITADTVFHAASVSKQFTAFATALLAADGKVQLDASIRSVLKEVPDFGTPITPRQLIYHTSGLKDQWTLFVLGGMEMDSRLRQTQILRMVERQRDLNFKPGIDFAYSNTGYTLLAELVATVSGTSFRDFTDTAIFRPLQMDNTFFYDDVTELVPERAESYEQGDDDRWRRSLLNFDNFGATSLHTTVRDLLKWGRNFTRVQVGDEGTIRAITGMGRLDDGTRLNYGYGLLERDISGHRALWHNGSDAGYRSIFAVFPEDDFAVAILANRPIELIVPLTRIASIYLNGDKSSDSWRKLLPVKVEPERPVLDELVGHYYFEGRPLVVLEKSKGGLVAKTSGQDDREVIFRNDGSFDFGDEDRLWGTHYRVKRAANATVAAIEELGNEMVHGRRTVYRPIEPVRPERADLTAIVGDYFSDTLDITYSLYVRNGALCMKSIWSPKAICLRPTAVDHFEGDWPMHDVAIERDGQQRPVAIIISSERARGVRLDRIAKR